MSKNLLIFDFDGVIADTEKLWMASRLEVLNNEYGLNWDEEFIHRHFRGTSDKTKAEILSKMGISVKDDFWQKVLQKDIDKLLNGVALTEGVEEIFKMKEIEQCIATGGTKEKTKIKIDVLEIENYFPPQKVFTADMVSYGKPEPDLFLLAAESMGYNPEQCIVIEDSVAGLTAAIKAKMTPIAFIGHETSDYYLSHIKNLDVKYIFTQMADIKEFLIKNYI